jgi:tetratricopeptide (TPR) repeat protein
VNDRPASAPPEARPDLAAVLRAGVRADDLERLAAELELPRDAGELAVGRALVQVVVQAQANALRLGSTAPSTVSTRKDDSRVVDGRASFLVRLTKGGDQENVDLERLEDLRTLLAVARAGSLPQRRAAVLRIGELLQHGRAAGSDPTGRAIMDLLAQRTIPLAYELWQVCALLPGAEGRSARAEGERWETLCKELEQRVREFWDGVESEEPVAALADEQRVQLLVRTRDVSDELSRHLSAIIEGCDGVSDRAARTSLLSGLQHAGDARLLPALRSVIESGESDLLVPAARALGRIDDPRTHSALKLAYDRTAATEERLALAGALGIAGDRRGLPYVREALVAGDERLAPYALEALESLGGRDEVQAVLELLGHADASRAVSAVRTLGRIGDSRALSALSEVERNAPSAALRAEVEDALDAIAARMELLGEEAPVLIAATRAFDTAKHAALVRRKDPAIVRLRARWSLLLGNLWLAFGATNRAVARLEAAAALRPDWPAPVVTLAMFYARKKESAQALASFRRALSIDARAVEQHGAPARMLAHTFLRRAEAVQRDGRDDIARGLLEEALTLDLRRAPNDLRLALEQRLHRLRTKAS